MAYYIFRSSIPLWLLQPRRLRVPIIWSLLSNPSSLYSLSLLGNFILCTKHVDLWKLLLLSLYFSGIMVFLMHSMEILSPLYSPILLWATQVYFLSAQTLNLNLNLQEIFCIVEGGQNQAHPFRRTRDAVADNEDFTVTHSPWTNRWVIIAVIGFSSLLSPVRLHVTYRRLIPAIEVGSSTF